MEMPIPSGRCPMSVSIPSPKPSEIVYPESDGKPMAENTLQFEWIVTIKEGLARAFAARPDVFVAGDLLWYPVEGRPDICAATRRHGGDRPAAGLSRLLQTMGRRRHWPTGCFRGAFTEQPGRGNGPEAQVL